MKISQTKHHLLLAFNKTSHHTQSCPETLQLCLWEFGQVGANLRWQSGGFHNRLPWAINKLIIQYWGGMCRYACKYGIYVNDYVYITYVCMHVCTYQYVCMERLPCQMTSQLSLIWDARQCWWWQTRNSRSPKPFTTKTWRTKTRQPLVTCPHVNWSWTWDNKAPKRDSLPVQWKPWNFENQTWKFSKIIIIDLFYPFSNVKNGSWWSFSGWRTEPAQTHPTQHSTPWLTCLSSLPNCELLVTWFETALTGKDLAKSRFGESQSYQVAILLE